MPKNKFYMVTDPYNSEGLCNIVIAPTARKAKVIGSYCEATENLECWTDLEVKAVKAGQGFFWQSADEFSFAVNGEGFLYTDLKAQLDSHWDLFFKELYAQKRYIKEDD